MSLIIDDIHKITAAVKATFSHIRAKVQMKTNIVIIIIRNDMTKIAGIISLDFIVLIFKVLLRLHLKALHLHPEYF